MSETFPTTSDQMDGEQFDAEAAQKARVVLEGGSSVGEDGVIRQDELAPGDGMGSILDTKGQSLNGVAKLLYSDHKSHQGNIVGTSSAIEENRKEYGKLLARRTELDELGKDAGGLTPDQAEQRDNLTWHMRISNEVKDDDLEPRLRSAIVESKANLWDAQQHLKQNQAGYEAAAIKGANAAGHDISFGGVEYPANPSNQPQPTTEQPRQQ